MYDMLMIPLMTARNGEDLRTLLLKLKNESIKTSLLLNVLKMFLKLANVYQQEIEEKLNRLYFF